MVADADGAEEALVARVGGDELADGFPQEQERGVAFLVFLADEGAAQFEGWAEGGEKAAVEVEEGGGVEAMGGGEIGSGEAVGSGDFAAGGVPDEEVEVVGVEAVEVAGAAGAFAGGAEGDFAEAADFIEEAGHLACGGEVDGEAGGGDEFAMKRERGDLGGEFGGVGWGGDGPRRGARAAGEKRDAGVGLARGAAGEEEGAPAEEVHALVVGGDGEEAGGVDGVADAEVDVGALFVPELAREEGGAETGVEQSGEVEGGAVAAAEVNGHDGGGAFAAGGHGDGAGEAGAPWGVGDA